MGLRATIIKTYKVEYGEAQGFNYGSEFLSNLISNYCDCCNLGGEFNDMDSFWSVDKGEFADMVKKLEEMPAREFNKRAVNEWGAEKDDGFTKSYVLRIFKAWLKETDPDSDWVRFGWL